MLLSTKLFPPILRPHLVARPQLIEQLNTRQHHLLVLVSAPAGFGKSTLVRTWLAAGQRPFGWLSVDEQDNDPTRFFTYVVAALQQVDQTIGASITDWHQPTSALLRLVNDIVAFGEALTLILDDYHLIDSVVIHQTLDYLLEYCPPNLQLVLISRTDPPLALARLRVRAQLTEIRAQDLRFTQHEAARFFATTTSLVLTPAEVTQLEERTEGWIAGLQMAAIALQSSNAAAPGTQSDFIRNFSGSHRYISDYLIDEVLNRQPERIHDFLMQTAILERMCAANVAATALGFSTGEAQSILAQLDGANLFIVALDEERHWYRYHQLFAQLLQRRFQQQDAVQATAAHCRASQWYLKQDLLIEAVNHALKGEDFALAADLVETIGVAQGSDSVSEHQLSAWLNNLPIAIIQQRPKLTIQYITTQYKRNPQQMAIEALLAKFAQATPTTGMSSDAFAFLNSFRLQISIWQGAVEHTRKLIQETAARLPAMSPLARCFVVREYFRFQFEQAGDLDEAERCLQQWTQYGEEAGLGFTAVAVPSRQGDLELHRGKLQAAERNYRQAMAAMTQPSDSKRSYLYQPLLGLAQIYYRQQRLSEALAYAEQANRLPIYAETDATYPEFRLYLAATLATIHLARQAPSQALPLVHDIGHFALAHASPYHQRLGAVTEAHLWLALGEVDRVAGWAEKATTYPFGSFRPLFAQEQLTLARYELLTHRPAAAQTRLAALLPVVEAAGWPEKLMEGLVLQALVDQAVGDGKRALQLLQRALTLAEPAGYVALFVQAGAPMAELLQQAKRNVQTGDFIAQLLVHFSGQPKPAVPLAAPPPAHSLSLALVEPLSKRELELLPLLAAGHSNREIALQLSISHGTVERHLANIYGKLQVNNRTGAIARARALNLLP